MGENLLKRGISTSARCIRCGELETTYHLIFHSEFAKKVWRLAPFKTAIEHFLLNDFASALRSLRSGICLPPTEIGMGPLFPWLCWSIWTAHNKLLFENRIITMEETLTKAVVKAREWQWAQTMEVMGSDNGSHDSHSYRMQPSNNPTRPNHMPHICSLESRHHFCMVGMDFYSPNSNDDCPWHTSRNLCELSLDRGSTSYSSNPKPCLVFGMD